MANIQYVTKEGLEKLREELHQLETFERPKISQQIADARDKGDLSENAEYDAAKEAQGMLEMQIAKLKEVIAYARVIDESKLDHSKVSILSKVKIKNTANGQELVYTLVPESEADLAKMRISVNTPIAKGLLGKSLGEIAEITLPNGMTLNFEILEISLD
ncbi:transcription elongation factor GreA [Empedobacter tilapiae]|uniref:Transcription elongation factor GreA n=1 Tax=Empedobacter tilapiae TaxID=2491114 RepID=A0A4Z1BE56_9FLAO|nr:transcription elongation factor GreA [Empedobacter tilapiae]TGN26017.1 transcription elongation factor GreA [Empedobacter tilapiae]